MYSTPAKNFPECFVNSVYDGERQFDIVGELKALESVQEKIHVYWYAKSRLKRERVL